MSRYLWILIAIVASLVSGVYFLNRFDPCDTLIERTLLSPGKDKSLVVFRRDCGATVDFNTQVSVMPSGAVFTFDDYPPFFGVAGKSTVRAGWLSNSRVRIVAPTAGRIFKKANAAGGVVVIYD